MIRNLGIPERLLRLVAGVLILGLFGAIAPPWRYLTLIGLIPLGTAITGHCPIYRALGWRRAAP
jgi:Inner membrane protein YgaP-like, transmembrane domain